MSEPDKEKHFIVYGADRPPVGSCGPFYFPPPMTLERAVAVLNEKVHRRPLFHTPMGEFKWKIFNLGIVGKIVSSDEADDHAQFLSAFEAIAIAEKYEREGK